MRIIDFTIDHLAQAERLAKINYEEERAAVPALPPVDKLPDFMEFTLKRGVAAVGKHGLLGFFCWYEPWERLFGLSKGVWSPVHAHGVVEKGRAEIYARLYQAAADLLVNDGVFCHSVTLYEHDAAACGSFVLNGFGLRCVDAIRETQPIIIQPPAGAAFKQAGTGDVEILTEMRNATGVHLSTSPMFMPHTPVSAEETEREMKNGKFYFLAYYNERPAAYIRVQETGETFAAADNSVMNITGAYAFPEFRGTSLTAGLLAWLMDWLRERGVPRCGVDFECFNYTGRKFWLKYFTAYTRGVVRRIDERIK